MAPTDTFRETDRPLFLSSNQIRKTPSVIISHPLYNSYLCHGRRIALGSHISQLTTLTYTQFRQANKPHRRQVMNQETLMPINSRKVKGGGRRRYTASDEDLFPRLSNSLPSLGWACLSAVHSARLRSVFPQLPASCLTCISEPRWDTWLQKIWKACKYRNAAAQVTCRSTETHCGKHQTVVRARLARGSHMRLRLRLRLTDPDSTLSPRTRPDLTPATKVCP